MSEENIIGLAPYSNSQGAKRGPRQIFAKLQEKCRLRAALAVVQAEIDGALSALSPVELQELQTMMAVEVAAVDVDVESLRAQVEQEAALARTTKPMQVHIPRRAAAVLAAEAERRIARGVYPSAEGLIGEAVAKAFAGVRP